MGIITNKIKTVFTSQGGKAVAKETDTVGRAQTRMGQASASAGRSFAAQSTGLGGLVGAYAGAAATMFALQAAFSALSKAAAVENVVRGTNALAAASGQSGPKILKNIKAITQGQLSLAEAAQSANLALSSGFSSKQIEQFTSVALKASVALGRDFSDAYTRMIKGSAKLEPELLDELGILTRIDPAMKAYARQIGVAVTELSQFDKVQAFANAAIEEGNRKFAAIDTTAPSAQKSLAQLQVQVSNLSTEFAQLVTHAILPLVELFSKDAGNSLVLFGGVLLLVFSKAKQIVGGFLSHNLLAFETWSTGAIQNLNKVKASMDTLNASSLAFGKDIAKRGGRGGSDFTDPVTKQVFAKGSGIFTNSKNNPTGLPAKVASEATQIRIKLLKQETFTIKEQQRAILVLSSITNANTKDRIYNGVVLKNNTHAYSDAVRMMNMFTTAQVEAGVAANFLSRALVVARGAATFLGAAFSWFFSITSAIFLVSSVLEVFGLNVIGGIVEWFTKLDNKAEATGRGMVGVFTAAAGGSKVFTDNLRQLGATDSDLENVAKKFAKISTEVSSLNSMIVEYNKRAAYIAKTNPASLGRKLTFDEAKTVTDYSAINQGTTTDLQNLGYTNIAALDKEKIALKQLHDLQIQVGAARATGTTIDPSVLQDIEYYKAYIVAIGKFDESLFSFIGDLSTYTGLSAEQIASTFDSLGVQTKGLGNTFTLAGINFANAFDFMTADENVKEFIGSFSTANNVMRETNEAYAKGAVTASSLSQVIVSVRNAIDEQNASLLEAQRLNKVSSTEYAIGRQEIAKLVISLDDLIQRRDDLAALEKTYTNLVSAFSSQISSIANPFSGDFDFSSTGAIKAAANDNEVFANRNKLLEDTIQLTQRSKNTQVLVLSGMMLPTAVNDITIMNKEAEIFDKSMEVALGTIFEIHTITTKMTKEENKKAKILTDELTTLTMQNQIIKDTAKEELRVLKAKNALDNQQRQIDITKAKQSVEQKYLEILQKQATAVADMRKDGLTFEEKQRIAEIKLENSTIKKGTITSDTGIAAADAITSLIDNASSSTEKAISTSALSTAALVKQAAIDAELVIFDMESQLIRAKATETGLELRQKFLLLKSQIAADISTIQAKRDMLFLETNIILAQLDGYETFNNSTIIFGTTVLALGELFKGFLTSLPAFLGAKPSNLTIPATLGADLLRATTTTISTARDSLVAAESAQQKIYIEQIAALNAKKDASYKIFAQETLALAKESLLTETERAAKRAEIEAKYMETTVETNNAIAMLGDTAGDTADKMKETIQAMFDAVKRGIETALTSLNDLIFYGEGNFKDILGTMFKSIQQDFFKTTIADPLSNALTDKLFSLVGYEGGSGGIDKAVVKNGALIVSFAQDPFTGLFDKKDPAKTGTTNLEESVTGFFGSDGFIAKGFSAIFGEGGFLSTLLGGFGNFLGTIFKGIFSLFTGAQGGLIHSAQGGLIHMAQGGRVMSLRDRVPAMLEPGEFVIRKPMARQLGVSNLQSMNATGKMPNSAPIINITNEGTPKNMEASPVRFDGEKYVIDIVMRDFENNGPIRRTLRSGGL